MTKLEQLLKEAKTAEEILNMQSCLADNLTEDEVIELKAKYLKMDTQTTRNLLAGVARLKKQMAEAEENLKGMQPVINCL